MNRPAQRAGNAPDHILCVTVEILPGSSRLDWRGDVAQTATFGVTGPQFPSANSKTVPTFLRLVWPQHLSALRALYTELLMAA